MWRAASTLFGNGDFVAVLDDIVLVDFLFLLFLFVVLCLCVIDYLVAALFIWLLAFLLVCLLKPYLFIGCSCCWPSISCGCFLGGASWQNFWDSLWLSCWVFVHGVVVVLLLIPNCLRGIVEVNPASSGRSPDKSELQSQRHSCERECEFWRAPEIR